MLNFGCACSSGNRDPSLKYRRHASCLCTLFHINLVNIINLEDVRLVEFMYLVFTRMPGESYRRRLGSLLLYLSYVLLLCISGANELPCALILVISFKSTFNLLRSVVYFTRTTVGACWLYFCVSPLIYCFKKKKFSSAV